MPKIDSQNTSETVKTGSATEPAEVGEEISSVNFTEINQSTNDGSEMPEEDITIYLDEFEISQLIMDSAIKNFEKSLNNVK